MPIPKKELESKIIKKIKERFEVKDRGGKHKFYEIYYKGKEICKTWCSHGGKDIPDSILVKIRKELLLDTRRQLDGLKDCPFTSENYFNLLKQKNVISN